MANVQRLTASPGTMSTPTVATLIDDRGVVAVYQPLVDLDGGGTVGYEALARGPAGTGLESPLALFQAARVAGLEAEMDRECQRAALSGALQAGLGPGQALFLNFEPRSLRADDPPWLAELRARALRSFDVFAEFTERSSTDRPADLLAGVARLRRMGMGIALDDVGADPRSLAMMPFLRPDVIKLDLQLVHDAPTAHTAEVIHAVGAEAQRSGSIVLAEGIENETHRRTALSLGARLAQGWLFGRPAPLGAPSEVVAEPLTRIVSSPPDLTTTPCTVVAQTQSTRPGDKRLMLALSTHIEAQALSLGHSAVILSSFQQTRNFDVRAQQRYATLAASAALVAAFGIDLTKGAAVGVRCVPISCADSLHNEWDVIVIGPHFAMAFVALDRGDEDVNDLDRRFDFAITYEREVVIAAARTLMNRLGDSRETGNWGSRLTDPSDAPRRNPHATASP